MKTAPEEPRTTREQRLLDGGWRILASANDTIFVVESPYSDVQVLHFYFDAANNEPMVEGYVASSLARRLYIFLLNPALRSRVKFVMGIIIIAPPSASYILRAIITCYLTLSYTNIFPRMVVKCGGGCGQCCKVYGYHVVLVCDFYYSFFVVKPSYLSHITVLLL